MDVVFPFGFPLPTAFYLVMYVVTLMIHVVFMNYVLAGTGYLAVASLFSRRGAPAEGSPVQMMLTDWMPFLLGASITAGVAPLLFVQILYQKEFYTANLLLFHRWMAILPVLIVGFYMLYAYKSQALAQRSPRAHKCVAVIAFACLAFTAYSWTENHVLSKQNPAVWSFFYTSQSIVYRDAEILPRLLVWFIGAIPTMVLMVSWQLWYRHRHGDLELPAKVARYVSKLALAGLVCAILAVIVGYALLPSRSRGAICSPMTLAYVVAAAIGAAIQVAAWTWQWRRPAIGLGTLVAASAGLLLTILGMTIAREAVRLAAVDVSTLYDSHARAFEVGGLGVFVVFFVLNAGLIAVSVLTIRRSLRRAGSAPSVAAITP